MDCKPEFSSEAVHSFVDELFGEDLHAKRVTSLAKATVRAPTPEDEDRRRVSRERKALTSQRIRHVHRLKGLLFGQGITGYEPLQRDRRKRLDELVSATGGRFHFI